MTAVITLVLDDVTPIRRDLAGPKHASVTFDGRAVSVVSASPEALERAAAVLSSAAESLRLARIASVGHVA